MRLLLIMMLALAGCAPPESRTSNDQCLRAKIFKECLVALPAGPASTKYNDWNEVVAACENSAYYQSLRKRENIKEECQL